jgi:hypothetical protein
MCREADSGNFQIKKPGIYFDENTRLFYLKNNSGHYFARKIRLLPKQALCERGYERYFDQ